MGKFIFKTWQWIRTVVPSLPRGPYPGSPVCSATHRELNTLRRIHCEYRGHAHPYRMVHGKRAPGAGCHHHNCPHAVSKSSQKNVVARKLRYSDQTGQLTYTAYPQTTEKWPIPNCTPLSSWSWGIPPANGVIWQPVALTTFCSNHSLLEAEIMCAMTKVRVSPIHL